MKLKSQYHRLRSDQRLYQLKVPVIGLTGGIASGKSTVAKHLAKQGLAIINADHLVKDVYARPETKEFLKSYHPEVLSDGGINFRLLREKVFSDPSVKAQIENFIYQHLPDAFIQTYHQLKNPPFVIYDIPLLFEKKLEHFFDLTVLVYAPQAVQRSRLMSRDGIQEDLAQSILDQQMNIEDKKQKAEFIIDNSGPENQLAESTQELLRQILD